MHCGVLAAIATRSELLKPAVKGGQGGQDAQDDSAPQNKQDELAHNLHMGVLIPSAIWQDADREHTAALQPANNHGNHAHGNQPQAQCAELERP